MFVGNLFENKNAPPTLNYRYILYTRARGLRHALSGLRHSVVFYQS